MQRGTNEDPVLTVEIPANLAQTNQRYTTVHEDTIRKAIGVDLWA